MGKDKGKKSEAQSGSSTLAHNPFAQLKGRLELPVAEEGPPAEGELVTNTERAPTRTPPRHRGRLVQRRETKHRGGKAVIVVSGFAALTGFERGAVEELARELKAKLGCGGTVEEQKGGGLSIVIQGDQAKKLAELLRAKGFRVDGVVE